MREAHDVELAVRVLREARQPVAELVVLVSEDPQLARRALARADEQLAALVVAEDVPALQDRLLEAAVDVATDHRHAPLVVVLRDRGHEVRGDRLHGLVHDRAAALLDAAGGEPEVALAHVPAVVAAASDDVDLLDVVLPHVTDPVVARLPVDRPLEGVAQPVRPDLAQSPVDADERVVLGNPVVPVRSAAAVDVDTQDLSERHAHVLGVAAVHVPDDRADGVVAVVVGVDPEQLPVLVVRPTAVAELDVEHPVGSEDELAAVVVPLRLGHPEQHP